jgi:hypothetical protein
MSSQSNNKQVIYVDPEDEVTGIIDKVGKSESKVVALVLPKRASVFQSVVNMKLLKKRADDAQKHVVLITSEQSLLPLAGMSGLHVAPSLQSRPEIPAAATGEADEEEPDIPVGGQDEPAAKDDFDPEQSANKPVGELAGLPPDDDAPLEIDNRDSSDSAKPGANAKTDAAAVAAGKKGKPPKDPSGKKKFHIPNFLKFRKRLLLAILIIIILVVAYFVAFRILPHAVIAVKTDASDVNSTISMTLDTSKKKLDKDQKLVPAQLATQQKTYSQKSPATGQKNDGDTATGNITMTVCAQDPSDAKDVPAGIGVSTSNLTYITQSTAHFHPTFQSCDNGVVAKSNSVDIKAQKPGDQYNTSDASFSVSGRPNVSAQGSADGGSDDVSKVVQQSDIDSAKKQLAAKDEGDFKHQLEASLKQNNVHAIPASFTTSSSKVSASAKAGDETDSVTVTETITYTMYGAKTQALKALIKQAANQQIDSKKQSILSYGLNKASFSVPQPGQSSQLGVVMDVTSTAGPKLDAGQLKKQAVGKKSGKIRSTIKKNPGVTNVDVKFSPFWVSTVSNPDKITVRFEKSGNNGG